MRAYYNEFDPFAAAWLGKLMKEGLVPRGEIDTRSIADVRAIDLAGFDQCHFFAGIGGWSHALRLAGWPDDEPIWTGSCPCQPFSAAGKRRGTADERHLWPEFQRLIAECRPSVVFGEQVASKDGRRWLAGVRADLEALGYGVGAADLCAAGAGAPHIRQRLFWVADAMCGRTGHAPEQGMGAEAAVDGKDRSLPGERLRAGVEGASGERVADANGGLAGDGHLQPGRQHGQQPQDRGIGERLGNAPRNGRGQERALAGRGIEGSDPQGRQQRPWGNSILIPCSDGKSRRVPANEAGELEPALFPLAHGVSNRVGTLRGAGNAIVPQVAAEFVSAARESARANWSARYGDIS